MDTTTAHSTANTRNTCLPDGTYQFPLFSATTFDARDSLSVTLNPLHLT
ncbi:MAG: hypothetical protein WBA74_22235 [Cyclobacteriaceae bacterium]